MPIMTVTGAISPPTEGVSLIHEHLHLDMSKSGM